jgi:hypothetical protein
MLCARFGGSHFRLEVPCSLQAKLQLTSAVEQTWPTTHSIVVGTAAVRQGVNCASILPRHLAKHRLPRLPVFAIHPTIASVKGGNEFTSLNVGVRVFDFRTRI